MKDRFSLRRRRWRQAVLRAALVLTLGGTAAQGLAADYLVTNLNDSGAGSLRDAIIAANAAPAGTDTITFDATLTGGTLNLDSMLPMIQKSGGTLNIQGLGADDLTVSGQNQHRILFVDSGAVTVEGVALTGGRGQGGQGGDFGEDPAGGGGGGLGAGGAVFVNANGNVTLRDVSLSENEAAGGDGGSYAPIDLGAAGGGGGGLGGDGGRSGERGGGGGGGLGGNGADGPPAYYGFSGSGGGGLTDDGTAALNGSPENSSVAGQGGGEGGDGGSAGNPGQDGQTFGGGGGGGDSRTGGAGGDFGGGGGGGGFAAGGDGGFGGGGGGTGLGAMTEGQGGFGGGDGGTDGHGGDGGDGFGGAVFVREGGQLTFENVAFTNNVATAGNGGSGYSSGKDGSNGTAAGETLFTMDGVTPRWIVPESGDTSVDATLFGGSGLTKSGDGTLELAGGSAILKSLQVDSGKVVINTTIQSDVTVNTDGTLGGSGTITGQLFLNGTLAPGNSIGTVTVNGNATFHAGSTTQIEINDGGNTPGVHNDLIDVNGDATTNGGEVDVLADAGNYTAGTVYTFLTADNVTGTFDSITDNLAFFDAALIYNSGNVQFELFDSGSDFAAVASTFNQTALGNYVDENSQGLPPLELQLIVDEMRPMTDGQVQHSLDQLSGAIYGTLPTAQLQHTSYYLSQLTGRLRSQLVPTAGCRRRHVRTSHRCKASQPASWLPNSRPSEWSAWLSGYGLGGRGESDGNADGFRYGLGGTQLAVQRRIDRQHNWGGWANMAWSQLRGERLQETAQLENYHFGSYLTGFDGRNYYLLLGGLGYDHGDVQRQIQIGQLAGNTQGQIDGWQASSYLERGIAVTRAGWTTQPYMALQYLYLRQGSLQERGAGLMNLSLGGVDAHSLRSVLGGRFSKHHRTSRGAVVTPEFRAAWLHEFLDTRQGVQAGLGGLSGGGFAVRGVDLGRDWVDVGGGFYLATSPGSRWFAGYDLQFNDRQAFHVGSGGLEMRW